MGEIGAKRSSSKVPIPFFTTPAVEVILAVSNMLKLDTAFSEQSIEEVRGAKRPRKAELPRMVNRLRSSQVFLHLFASQVLAHPVSCYYSLGNSHVYSFINSRNILLSQ
jgi:hypothetical protein